MVDQQLDIEFIFAYPISSLSASLAQQNFCGQMVFIALPLDYLTENVMFLNSCWVVINYSKWWKETWMLDNLGINIK